MCLAVLGWGSQRHFAVNCTLLVKCGVGGSSHGGTNACLCACGSLPKGNFEKTLGFSQAPLDLSGLQGRDGHHPSLGGVQQPPLPQQLPSSAPGMFGSGGPYGVATANGTFEVLQQHHPMAGLHASMGQSLAGLQPLPQQLQQVMLLLTPRFVRVFTLAVVLLAERPITSPS